MPLPLQLPARRAQNYPFMGGRTTLVLECRGLAWTCFFLLLSFFPTTFRAKGTISIV